MQITKTTKTSKVNKSYERIPNPVNEDYENYQHRNEIRYGYLPLGRALWGPRSKTASIEGVFMVTLLHTHTHTHTFTKQSHMANYYKYRVVESEREILFTSEREILFMSERESDTSRDDDDDDLTLPNYYYYYYYSRRQRVWKAGPVAWLGVH
jgi:hypothetical protein